MCISGFLLDCLIKWLPVCVCVVCSFVCVCLFGCSVACLLVYVFLPNWLCMCLLACGHVCSFVCVCLFLCVLSIVCMCAWVVDCLRVHF